MGVIRILILFCFALPAFGQLGMQSPFFVSARLKAIGGGGCETPNAPSSCIVDDTDDPPNHVVKWTETGSFDGVELAVSTDGGGFVTIGGIAPATGGAGVGSVSYGTVGDQFVYIFKARTTNACGTQSAFSNTVTNDIWADAYAYWRMEEAAGNDRVDAIASLHLSESTATVARGAGANNFAADLTANHHILNNLGGVSVPAPCSLSMWVNVASYPVSGADIMGIDDGADTSPFIGMSSSGEIQIGNNSDGVLGNSSPVSTGSFHSIILTVDAGTTWKLSIDGGAFQTLAPSSAAATSTTIRVGSSQFGGDTFIGKIDELGVFTRTLSQAEATSIAGGRYK